MYVGSMMSEDYTNCHSFLLAYEDDIGFVIYEQMNYGSGG
jgi:hypothetical protein